MISSACLQGWVQASLRQGKISDFLYKHEGSLKMERQRLQTSTKARNIQTPLSAVQEFY